MHIEPIRAALAVLIAAVLLTWQFWPAIRSIAARLQSGSATTSTTTADEDAKDFAALDRLRRRSIRNKNQALREAIGVALLHFDDTQPASE